MTINARTLTASLCLAALSITFMFPAWAQIQQAAYYYGYADIGLVATGPTPTQASAGTTVMWPMRLTNIGPDPVGAGKIDLNASAGANVFASSGCINAPVNTSCAMPLLATGAFRDVMLSWSIHPSARGTVTLTALGSSETVDLVPGNQQLQTVVRIEPRLDISAQALSVQPQVLPNGNLRWEFSVINAGPADALTPTISFSATQILSSTCLSGLAVNARCPGSVNGAFLGAAGELRYEVITPSLTQLPNQILTLNAATLSAELDLLPRNNVATVRAVDAISRDGFE
jgi:hypothetical protein